MPASSLAQLRLEWLPGRYAVCRLDAGVVVPAWAADSGGLLSITRTDRELSVVINESRLPDEVPLGIKVERNFVAMRVAGTLDFNLVGVLAKLTGALADAGVPVFVISTFETDYLQVKAGDQARAATALMQVAITP